MQATPYHTSFEKYTLNQSYVLAVSGGHIHLSHSQSVFQAFIIYRDSNKFWINPIHALKIGKVRYQKQKQSARPRTLRLSRTGRYGSLATPLIRLIPRSDFHTMLPD